MSIITCDNCDQPIDTDEDDSCFVFFGQGNVPADGALCRACRNETDDDIRWATETGQTP